MKKFLLLLLTSCLAWSLQAAAIAWSISNISALPNGTVASAGWVAYFMDGTTYNQFSQLAGNDSTKGQIGKYAAENMTYTATTVKAGRGGAINVSATSGNYGEGTSVSGYIVLFNDADATKADYYAVTALETKQAPDSGNIQFQKDFSTETDGWQSMAIPEPTSGLLMLLGVAGLALKRKRI